MFARRLILVLSMALFSLPCFCLDGVLYQLMGIALVISSFFMPLEAASIVAIAATNATKGKIADSLEGYTELVVEGLKNASNNTSPKDTQFRISPSTMDSDFELVSRLCVTFGFFAVGTVFNGIYISSFFVEDSTRTRNRAIWTYLYMCAMGLADLIISGIACPITIFMILADQWQNAILCRTQQFLIQSSTYVYSIMQMIVGLLMFFRISRTKENFQRALHNYSPYIIICVIVLCALTSYFGVKLKLDYDHCERESYGNVYYRLASGVILYIIPTTAALTSFVCAHSFINDKKYAPRFRYTQFYIRNRSAMCGFILKSIAFIISWAPYSIASFLPQTSDKVFFYLAWLGILRAMFVNMLFGITNDYLRKVICDVCKYCFCKVPLTRISYENWSNNIFFDPTGFTGELSGPVVNPRRRRRNKQRQRRMRNQHVV